MTTPFKEAIEGRDSRHISPLLKIALLLGILVHLAGFFIFRVISNPLPSREKSSAFIALVPTHGAADETELNERARLFDSAPLFIPVEWSSASEVFASKAMRDWQVFPEFEPRIELEDAVRPGRLSLSQGAGLEQPSDLLDLRFWDLFSYFGQAEEQSRQAGDGSSVAEVVMMSGPGELPEDFDLRLEVDLETKELAARPVEVFLNMYGPGLAAGAPIIRQSSGSDSLDAAVLEWLNQPDTRAQLPAGFLKIRVFP